MTEIDRIVERYSTEKFTGGAAASTKIQLRRFLEWHVQQEPNDPDQVLSAMVEGQQLVIRIGVATLAFAFEHSEDAMLLTGIDPTGKRKWRVADKLKFAQAIADAMNEENHGGDTPLEAFLEQQFRTAVENDGGVEEVK